MFQNFFTIAWVSETSLVAGKSWIPSQEPGGEGGLSPDTLINREGNNIIDKEEKIYTKKLPAPQGTATENHSMYIYYMILTTIFGYYLGSTGRYYLNLVRPEWVYIM